MPDPTRRSVAYDSVTTRSRWAVLAGLALPMAACAVGLDFVPQPAPIAHEFIGASNRSVKSTSITVAFLI
jgi:hypothetical protein